MGIVALGDDYLAWVKPAGGAFVVIDGQGTLSESRASTKIDTSSKNKRGYNTGAYGNKSIDHDMDVKVTLPDPGYLALETACNASPATPFTLQIRGGGVDGVDADKIYEASVYGSIASRTFNKDGTVDAKVQFTLADEPAFDQLGQ